jgi:NAD(P)-dependent dehydrogenase (short-subunit alcohol dehydrogenase family)
LSILEGKCAVVTGGARGIGRAISHKLGRMGADVAVVDLLEAEAAETARQVEAMGRRSVSIVCDVSS